MDLKNLGSVFGESTWGSVDKNWSVSGVYVGEVASSLNSISSSQGGLKTVLNNTSSLRSIS